jgi:CheY-like chemotaxis protein
MVLPTDKMAGRSRKFGRKDAGKGYLKVSLSEKAVQDFILASRVEIAVAKEGHIMAAEADAGAVTLIINKNVIMLKKLEDELRAIASCVQGVQAVTTKVGKKFHQSDIVRKFDFETPSKLLIVDDERQFVQTLSERLRLREIGSVVAYDGESALSMIKEEEPDVMILDLKMPGIDGIEVLKRVKQTNPAIEVIILCDMALRRQRLMHAAGALSSSKVCGCDSPERDNQKQTKIAQARQVEEGGGSVSIPFMEEPGFDQTEGMTSTASAAPISNRQCRPFRDCL